jgi:dihydrofolate reductase
MGTTVYWMNVSVDGYLERTPGVHDGESWARLDEELHREFNERARNLSLMVEGRVIYEMMSPYWPDARDDTSQPEVIREFAHVWTDMPKVLVSNTRTKADHNTTIVGGDDAMGELARIREATNGRIGVGGATLATAMLEAGILDELMLFVHPAILGGGRPLFNRLDTPLQLDLLEAGTYGDGVVLKRYALRAASA